VHIAASELKTQLRDIAASHLQELVYEIKIENARPSTSTGRIGA